MPAKSKKQQRFFGWLKANPEERKRRKIDLRTVEEFARTRRKGLPERAGRKGSRLR